MCSIRLLRCVLCWCSTFFEHVVLRSCTANCGTSSIFTSQMAVGFWNAIRTVQMFLLEFSSLTQKESCFSSFLSCFKQCVLGLSGLLGLNTVIILPFYCNAIIVWSLEMFCVVSQAFTSMLAKRGKIFVLGCIGYHFDGLLSQLLVALHPLVLFIAVWLTSENAGYDWVGGGGGDVTECIVYMFRAMTL